MTSIENSTELTIDFNKITNFSQYQVIPVVIQDINTQQVLIVAYTNQEAFDYTIKHKIVALWSTSRNELWIKGATSGEYLDLKHVYINCEQNSLLYKVSLRNKAVCHVKDKNNELYFSCFFREVVDSKLKYYSM